MTQQSTNTKLINTSIRQKPYSWLLVPTTSLYDINLCAYLLSHAFQMHVISVQ